MLSEGKPAPDLGMPTQAGNNALFKLVKKAKSEKELIGMIDKLSKKMGGKYKDANDELITRAAVDTFNQKDISGMQKSTDRNVFVQMKGASDLRSGEIILDDGSKIKVKGKDAAKVVSNLLKLKTQQRGQVQKAMQKDKKGFNKFFKILNR